VALNTGKLTKLELETEIVRRFIPIVTTTNKIAVVDSILKLPKPTEIRYSVGLMPVVPD
jgi:hypothetical protein